MELIFKQPKDKPPCICILFANEYEAGRHQQQIVNQFQKHPLNIKFELKESKLNMTLKVFTSEFKYEDLKFSPDKFYQFLYHTKDSEAFTMCHVILKNDKHIVVLTATNRLNWVLKIDSVELISEY